MTEELNRLIGEMRDFIAKHNGTVWLASHGVAVKNPDNVRAECVMDIVRRVHDAQGEEVTVDEW